MSDKPSKKWQAEFLNQEALDEFEAFGPEIQAKFFRIWKLVEEFGLPAVREPYIRQVEGKIYEFRMTGKDGIGRSLFTTKEPRRVVVLRSFMKKTRKTPQREIKLAQKRAKEA
ncbi:type II toxin-antitoxin system RelE/ParE family toxin [Desulfoferula mesophila]|uniref:Type II toxin-antitoxin system RelE/ParE family toxin n=1 Tax=Desulfoferula mesophila TaxID=3058419 RepID=A0AAU9E7H0_9BACT|nr:hypothetical protein FAK_01790 [Desulfoferula mesophilus]